MVDAFGWELSTIRKLSFRERKHWVDRYLFRLEQEYERTHTANNTNQTVLRSVGQGVTWGGIPYR